MIILLLIIIIISIYNCTHGPIDFRLILICFDEGKHIHILSSYAYYDYWRSIIMVLHMYGHLSANGEGSERFAININKKHVNIFDWTIPFSSYYLCVCASFGRCVCLWAYAKWSNIFVACCFASSIYVRTVRVISIYIAYAYNIYSCSNRRGQRNIHMDWMQNNSKIYKKIKEREQKMCEFQMEFRIKIVSCMSFFLHYFGDNIVHWRNLTHLQIVYIYVMCGYVCAYE